MAKSSNKSEMAQESAPKEQVIDQVPKRIKALQFGLFSPRQIAAQSVVEIRDRNLYDIGNVPGTPRTATQKGPLDPRLGTSNKTGYCETCGLEMIKCNGHFGQIRLTVPCFHYGYFKKIIDVLNCVCKECSLVMLPAKEKRAVLKRLRVRDLDRIQKARVVSNISESCKKVRICPHCNAHNGPVRKVSKHPIKMFHNKFAIYTLSNAKSKKKPAEMEEFEASFKHAIEFNPEIGRHMKRVVDDMTPIRVLRIFQNIPNADVELLGMDPGQGGRPEHMIWTHLPAPPVAIRPSVAQESASTEDDVTNKLGDIIQINNTLSAALRAGQPLSKVMDMWEFLNVQIAMYIDGNLPGLQKGDYGKAMRGFCQRLKGKQGRFRGNLSGKRVDFSGRTVISPDPNLSIEEVAVPARVAVNMTYPERVTKYNIDKLKACVRRGDKKHPGANFVCKADGRRIVLRIVNNKGALDKIVNELKVGDTVERHLEDGDIVLFNRQPSLHKLSILSHKVKVRPWRTFRLNECVCNPYNADFDGDEMNLHVPQTEEARAEAIELMGVKHNLATPKNGTPIIAAIQDFITGAYLVSQKDVFLNRTQFTHIMSSMFNGMSVRDPVTGEEYPIELPPPTILKPQFLWTGKQVWNMIMKPNRRYPVDVNVDAGLKQFAVPPRGVAPDMVDNDAYMVIRNSEVMCGAFDKAAIGDGKKNSVFFVIMRDFGPDYAAAAMNRLAKLSARWLGEQGFSIGINDVHPSEALNDKKAALVKAAYDKCDIIIRKFLDGKLERATGCDEEQTMEISVSGILSDVRQACGGACFAELSRLNAPLIMAMCGSKGSNINVSQMVAAVGQQTIGNKRVMDGFQDRSLPHFRKGSREPLAKGFVVDSFFSGLSPTEFVFHAMTGREGLVDTAVKTAETGYMSRRLIKSLEDLSTRYDQTVRNSASGIVQMKFGDDGLDPVDMEGTAMPVNFDRTFSHAVTSTWDNAERGLSKDEIVQLLDETLNRERAKLPRFSEDKSPLPYNETNEKYVDQMESNRNFLDHVETYVMSQAAKMMSSQKRLSHSENIFKLTASALEKFLGLCLLKFEKSKVEAGHAVGVVGAQSIGEPGTQMTLKTFHFAGVAGMSITQGVPRIKEIINASKVISTPIITCILDSPYEEMAARFVKARIEKVYVKDIVNYAEDVWEPDRAFINLRIDWSLVMNLGLSLSASAIARAIDSAKGMKALNVFSEPFSNSHIRIRIGAPSAKAKTKARNNPKGKIAELSETAQIYDNVQIVRGKLAEIAITGYPDAHRAVIKKDDKPDKTGREPISVFVEGYGLKACMTTEGVNGYKTTTNNVMECMAVLGIEAARQTIISEISSVMGNMDIDPRHMRLLADVMTRKGEVLGISRFGLAKSNDSVLQLASFEKTPDHLFDAAIKSKVDAIEGVSECIIMGQSMTMGTGAMEVVRPLNLDGITHEVPKSDFHVAYREVMAGRRQRTAERMAKYYKRPEAVAS